MPFVHATPLPAFARATEEARLRELCARWEGQAWPRLSPREQAHCRRFFPQGKALRARASRLLGRLLALRALPEDVLLDRDDRGLPRVTGAPGWRVAFSHSGRAVFCLVCPPGETITCAGAAPALDAETWGAPAPVDRAFEAPVPDRAASLRRWVLAEALFKALGAPPALWGSVAATAHAHASARAGIWKTSGARVRWRFLPAPGHILCVGLPGVVRTPLRLRWLAWQSLA